MGKIDRNKQKLVIVTQNLIKDLKTIKNINKIKQSNKNLTS